MFEPFAALVAFTPLVIYLFVLAICRVSGRTLVWSGAADTGAVLLAISGLVIVGPIELFFPKATAYLLGAWVWLPLLFLYFLFGCLWIINSRTSIVVYGRTSEQLFPAVLKAAQSIDNTATGDPQTLQFHLPKAGVHLRLDAAPMHDCVKLIAFEPLLTAAFWSTLSVHLRHEVSEVAAPRPRRGWAALGLAILITAWLVEYVSNEPQLLVDGFREWLVR
ncbi:hypothetical protein [Neorhodopirellula lusitana]|uniref:hypothetical protein n=1 Tax=Neorhodopirellula lusitana TaxID=445327 RepID=UPI00384CFA99